MSSNGPLTYVAEGGYWRLGAIDVIGGRPAGGRLVVLHAGQAFFVCGVGVDEELQFHAVGIADRDSTHEPEVHRAFHLGPGRYESLVSSLECFVAFHLKGEMVEADVALLVGLRPLRRLE